MAPQERRHAARAAPPNHHGHADIGSRDWLGGDQCVDQHGARLRPHGDRYLRRRACVIGYKHGWENCNRADGAPREVKRNRMRMYVVHHVHFFSGGTYITN